MIAHWGLWCGLVLGGMMVGLTADVGCRKTSSTDASPTSSGGTGGAPATGDAAVLGSGGGTGAGGATGTATTDADAPTGPQDPGATPYTLFTVDVANGLEIGALAVDDTHVYWGGYGGRLMRRALDGSGAEERVASWIGTALGLEVAVDQDYVYWLDQGQWLRGRKEGGGGEPEGLPLEARGGAVAADRNYAYVALVDCASVARVPHGGTTSEIIYPAKPIGGSTGLTYLLLDGSDIYCAGGHYVFVSHNWGPLVEITSAGVEVNGVAVLGGKPYWLDRTAEGSDTSLFSLATDGQITSLGTLSLFRPSQPIADDTRRRVLFSRTNVYGWSVDSGDSKVLVEQKAFTGYQAARDANFFYWSRYTTKYASIERMPIGQQ